MTCKARSTLLVGVLGLGVLVADTARAQDPGFLGVKDVHIVVEDLGQEGRACNVTEDGIDAAIRLPLDASRLRLNEKSADFIYANVSVRRRDDVECVAYVSLSLYRRLSTPEGQFVPGAVWHKGIVMGGGAMSDFVQRVDQRIGDLTKQLIAEWIKANPR